MSYIHIWGVLPFCVKVLGRRLALFEFRTFCVSSYVDWANLAAVFYRIYLCHVQFQSMLMKQC